MTPKISYISKKTGEKKVYIYAHKKESKNHTINFEGGYSDARHNFVVNRDKVCRICGQEKSRLFVALIQEPRENPENWWALCGHCLKVHDLGLEDKMETIQKMIEDGQTYTHIANYFSVSRQRIGQIAQSLPINDKKKSCKRYAKVLTTDSQV